MILVIDGQGGKLGAAIIKQITASPVAPTASLLETPRPLSNSKIRAVGTNLAATQAMLRAGADEAATGENACIVACRTADVIVGGVGIVLADGLLGEITPAMAAAVAQSRARKILVPLAPCVTVVGVRDLGFDELVQLAAVAVSA